MYNTNKEAAEIIANLQLSEKEVAKYLNVTTDVVKKWFEQDKQQQAAMPEADLHFLKYCLMTDNKRAHLF